MFSSLSKSIRPLSLGTFLLFPFAIISHFVCLFFFQGDLGAIDDKYDVAISTACGALDNIVCDSIDTAQKCISFLKQSNIGSATFIGLDKVCMKVCRLFQFMR